MDLIVDKDVPLMQVLNLVGLIGLSFFPLAIPIGILFSSMFALNKLSSDAEIMAMRACGVSTRKLFTPFFILSLVLGFFTLILDSFPIPAARIEIRKIVSLLTTKGALVGIKKGQFFTQIPQFTLYAEDVSNKGTMLWDVFIHMVNKDGTQEKIIKAKEGRIIKDGDDVTTFSMNLRMRLLDGNILIHTHNKNAADKCQVEKILYKEYEFPLDQNRNLPTLDSGPSLQSTLMLYDTMVANKVSKEELIRVELEFWSRINNPFICILFALLGLSLGIKQGRGRGKHSLSLCFVVLIGYYALFFSGLSMAKKATIPVLLGIGGPLFVLLIVSYLFFRKLEWNT